MSFYTELIDRVAAERQQFLAIPIIGDALEGRIGVETYIAFLREAYHHVKYTVPLLMACGARLPERLEWLREGVADYISEETGHEKWILDDISQCGGNSDAVRCGLPSLATDIMVAFAWDTVLRRNPVGFFGMVLVLEGTSSALATRAADALRKSTGIADGGFKYLSSHGSLDQQHMVNYKRLMDRLDDPADTQAVVHTARVMYRLYGDIFRSLSSDRNQAAA
jgi:hypothetical protein